MRIINVGDATVEKNCKKIKMTIMETLVFKSGDKCVNRKTQNVNKV